MLLPLMYNEPIFSPITYYFVSGAALGHYLFDTHGAFTYFAALQNGVFSTPGTFTINTGDPSPITLMGIQDPANPNQDEIQQLINFVQQEDNLEILGWDLEDFSTWEGVLWTEDAENRVQSIDIPYKFVYGRLDLTGFSALEYLDISGNLINEIDLSGCNSLIYLDCFYNLLEWLIVPSAEIVNCGFNRLYSLDVSAAVNLEELYCGVNELPALHLSNNTELTRLDCSDNNLFEIDLSASSALVVLRCEQNYLDIQEDSELWTQIQTIEGRTAALVSYAPQKMKDDFVLSAEDVAILTQFANQDDNLTKLGWNLSEPETWEGVQWLFANGQYHLQAISIDGLELTGNLDLSGMEQLVHVSCGNNNLTAIDVSDCERLRGISCRSAGISSLIMENTASMKGLDCEDNYLDLLEIIDDMNTISGREDAWVFYAKQRLLYSFTVTTPGLAYDDTSSMFVLDTIKFSTEGSSPNSVFIEVNTFDASDEKTYLCSDTVVINTSGVGTYSLGASPAELDAEGEYAEILVYTDNSRVQLVTRLVVRPILFDF